MKQFIDLPPVLIPRKPCITPIQIPTKPYGLDLLHQSVEQPNSTCVQRSSFLMSLSITGFNRFSTSCLVTFSPPPLAYTPIHRYSSFALSKISRLALVGYELVSAYSPLRAFFMRNISMRSHVMAKLWRDTFACAGILTSLSTNPLQLCHPHLVVNGKASNQSLGAHTHA